MPFPCYIIIDTDCPNCQKLMSWKYFQEWLEFVRKSYHVQVIDRSTAMALGIGSWECDEWGRLVYRIRTPLLWCMGHEMELVDENCFRHDPKRGKVIDPAVAKIRLWQARCLIARCFNEYMKLLGEKARTGTKGKIMLTSEEEEEGEGTRGKGTGSGKGRGGKGGGGKRNVRHFKPGSAP